MKDKVVFGTKEWARYSENIISGCSHDCRYCYAKTMAVRFKRKTVDNWKDETADLKKISRHFTKKNGRIMFPTTHDITPENLDYCMAFLDNILRAGNEVLIVSKPHLQCIGTVCNSLNQYRGNIMFRFTIGSTDDHTLKFWDQHAPSFDERRDSLSYAYNAGYETSISCEPMLDDKMDVLISGLLPFVTDAIWIGIGNQMTARLKINGHGDPETTEKARQLLASQSKDHILDLHSRYKDHRQIKWKESIKKMVGIEMPTESGLDV